VLQSKLFFLIIIIPFEKRINNKIEYKANEAMKRGFSKNKERKFILFVTVCCDIIWMTK